MKNIFPFKISLSPVTVRLRNNFNVLTERHKYNNKDRLRAVGTRDN